MVATVMAGHRGKSRSSVIKLPAQETGSGDAVKIGPDKSIRIDLSKLPSPTRVYDADCARILHSVARVSIIFGKRELSDHDKLWSLLEIRYPPELFVKQFWRNSREFTKGLQHYISQWPVLPEKEDFPTRCPAERHHSEWANLDCMSYAGSGGTIDFYWLPVPGIARFAQGQGSSGLVPLSVVRVLLTVFEFANLLTEAEEVIGEVVSYLPPEEQDAWKKEEGKPWD